MKILFLVMVAILSTCVYADASSSNPHGYVLTITSNSHGNLTGVLSDNQSKHLDSIQCFAETGAENLQLVLCGNVGPSNPQTALQSDEAGFEPDSNGVYGGGLSLSGSLIDDGPVQLTCESAGPQTSTNTLVFPITCK